MADKVNYVIPFGFASVLLQPVMAPRGRVAGGLKKIRKIVRLPGDILRALRYIGEQSAVTL